MFKARKPKRFSEGSPFKMQDKPTKAWVIRTFGFSSCWSCMEVIIGCRDWACPVMCSNCAPEYVAMEVPNVHFRLYRTTPSGLIHYGNINSPTWRTLAYYERQIKECGAFQVCWLRAQPLRIVDQRLVVESPSPDFGGEPARLTTDEIDVLRCVSALCRFIPDTECENNER